jgi:FlaA1/EpsC-like NDP-sugar epimerase
LTALHIRHTERWKLIAAFVALYDYVAVCAAYFSALYFRFDGTFSAIPKEYLEPYQQFIFWYAGVSVAIFYFFRMYNTIWSSAGFTDFMRTFMGSFVSSAMHIVLITLLFARMPLSYYVVGAVLQFAFIVAGHFMPRLIHTLSAQRGAAAGATTRVMLIGAGSAARMLLRDMSQSGKMRERAVCIIDDDKNKWGRNLDGIPIVGGRDEILAAAEKYEVDKIYLAIPSASAQQKRDILSICSETGCELMQLPGVYQLALGQISVSSMKKVSVEDLLGREPIKANMDEVFDFINGKVVLVTGGGGSIGSELCRQVASHSPKQLIIFDVYENNAYSIQLELRDRYPELDLVTLIGSVRDSRKMLDVFETYRPQVVYHAAAHKHVPLMEDSPCEAIKNNAIGTYKTAYAAMAYGCERFVLISTDKAVNPTNIMGASKRLCEMVVQAFDAKIKAGVAREIPQLFTHGGGAEPSVALPERPRTEFVAVRFGNVLGSNGSVIPIFRRQIERGGPVTVTHPDIIRYFMTIQEAVSLVMLAGTYAHGGEIFVLDMGSPVKIDTLARNMIRLSGYVPDVDIKVEYTGLRPGEKLYEEKLMAEEGLRTTDNELIHVGSPLEFDDDAFLRDLGELMEAAYANRGDIRELVERVVGTYHPENTGSKDSTYQQLADQSQ